MDLDISIGDLVIVNWLDTIDDCRWTNIKTIKDTTPPMVKSVGWLLSMDDNCVKILPAIVGYVGDIEDCLDAGYSIIPKNVVVSMEKVLDDEIEILPPTKSKE